MSQTLLILFGAIIALISSVVTLLIQYALTVKRDKDDWSKKEIVREEDYLLRRKDKAEDQLTELKTEIKTKTTQVAELEHINVTLMVNVILLRNQYRDILMGFNQDEQHKRASDLKNILHNLDNNEIRAIAEEEKPLPDLSGKPKL